MTALPIPTAPAAGTPAAGVRVDWRLVFGGAAALAILFTFQNYTSPAVQRANQTLTRTFVLQLIQWGLWLALSPVIFAAARRWRRDPRATAGHVSWQLFTSLGLSMLHAMLAGTARWTLGVSAFDDLGDVLAASILANFATNVLRYWLIASAYHVVAYHHEARARDVRAARLEGALVQARLDSLQGRLHPHFLFNTLNSIGALIREQPAAAEQMLGSLSELLRASLNAEPSREVTLARELDLLSQYVSIQQIRFQDRLTVSIDAAPDVQDAYVPHLVLQPLVENAIRHGIAPREAPGHVRIAARRAGDRLRLVVEDDGVGLAGARGSRGQAAKADGGDASGSGFGLSSTEARLQHLYGDGATFDVQPRTPTGLVVTVELPFHTSPVAAAEARA